MCTRACCLRIGTAGMRVLCLYAHVTIILQGDVPGYTRGGLRKIKK